MKKIFKSKTLLPVLFLAFCNGQHPTNVTEDGYIELECIELFNKPVNFIAVTVATVLNVYPVSFIDIVHYPSHNNHKGYRYITSGGAELSIWIDSLDITLAIIYNFVRYGNSNEFTCEKYEADSLFMLIIKELGIIPSEKD